MGSRALSWWDVTAAGFRVIPDKNCLHLIVSRWVDLTRFPMCLNLTHGLSAHRILTARAEPRVSTITCPTRRHECCHVHTEPISPPLTIGARQWAGARLMTDLHPAHRRDFDSPSPGP